MFALSKIEKSSVIFWVVAALLIAGLLWKNTALDQTLCLAPRSIPSAELKLILEIGPYPELQALVFNNPALKEALLADSVLRPVFLACPPEDSLGEVKINPVNKDLLEQYGGEELLKASSGFFAGTPKAAQRMLKRGYKIIAGVTDRPADILSKRKGIFTEGGSFNFTVANGRQVYFPLSDGTWLGVKGCGQFTESDKAPFFFSTHLNKWMGIAEETETEHLFNSFETVTGQATFVNTLGYRRIDTLCDGNGTFQEVSKLALRDQDNNIVNPVLIFNHTLTPHRCNKLPQLLQADPTLTKLIDTISGALIQSHKIATKFPKAEDYFAFLIAELAQSEAAKINSLQIKETIHSQDFTLAGEESDLEELMPFKTYLLSLISGEKKFTLSKNTESLSPYQNALQTVVSEEEEIIRKDFTDIEDLSEAELLLFISDSGFSTKLNLLAEILKYGHDKHITFLEGENLTKKYLMIYFTIFFREIRSEKVLDICSSFDKFSEVELALRKYSRMLTPKTESREEQRGLVDQTLDQLKEEIRNLAFPYNRPASALEQLDSSITNPALVAA